MYKQTSNKETTGQYQQRSGKVCKKTYLYNAVKVYGDILAISREAQQPGQRIGLFSCIPSREIIQQGLLRVHANTPMSPLIQLMMRNKITTQPALLLLFDSTQPCAEAYEYLKLGPMPKRVSFPFMVRQNRIRMSAVNGALHHNKLNTSETNVSTAISLNNLHLSSYPHSHGYPSWQRLFVQPDSLLQ